MATKAAPAEAPVLYVVRESFLASDGTVYAKGQVIHPDDPYLKRIPERFAPFEFPHPVKARTMASPEIRS